MRDWRYSRRCMFLGWIIVVIVWVGSIAFVLSSPAHLPTDYHHCVVRQTNVTAEGWELVLEGEVGAVWTLPATAYLPPGRTVYVGLFSSGWHICDPPK